MTSEIESKIEKVIEKLEKAQIDRNYLPTANETQEGNYRMHKRIAGVVTQANINVSRFDMQPESNQAPINESSNEKSNSFTEQISSDVLDQSLPKLNLNRRQSIILDLHKIINVGEYRIELGKLIDILDKKLPDNKENNSNNENSKNYTECTTEENECKKSLSSPKKKIEPIRKLDGNSDELSPKEKNEDNIYNYNEIDNDKKFQENLPKKYHKIYLLLKAYINENRLVNELNEKGLKENSNLFGKINLGWGDPMNMNYRRRSLFNLTPYLVPAESSIKSFTKNNKLPNLFPYFFEQKKLAKRKKRNTFVSGQIRNKLKKLNQQMETKSTSKQIPNSEKAEFKMKQARSSITNDSNTQFNNMSGAKNVSVSQISNFDDNQDSESIIENDNSVFYGNESKRGSLLFNGLSDVAKRRQSDFFDNFQSPQDEINGFHKMISTIIEEEDNININTVNNNPNNICEKNENKREEWNNDDKDDEKSINKDRANDNLKKKEDNDTENVEDKKDEDIDQDEDNGEEDEEYDDTIDNDDCFNGNISTSLCFDELFN